MQLLQAMLIRFAACFIDMILSICLMLHQQQTCAMTTVMKPATRRLLTAMAWVAMLRPFTALLRSCCGLAEQAGRQASRQYSSCPSLQQDLRIAVKGHSMANQNIALL